MALGKLIDLEDTSWILEIRVQLSGPNSQKNLVAGYTLDISHLHEFLSTFNESLL